MSARFDIAIRDRLTERRGDWAEIAEQSGVSHSWISKFVNGRIPNPGYATLEKLSTVLKPRRRGSIKPDPTPAGEVSHG